MNNPLTVFTQQGRMVFGEGNIAAVSAFTLAILCLFGVIAFHYPEYLTTPELRKVYSVAVLRKVLYFSLILSGGLALAGVVLRKQISLNINSLILIAISVALGGSTVPVGDFPINTPYVGLDWFILDLLKSTVIFVVIEKIIPLNREQPVFRIDWQGDLVHFIVNHLLVGIILLIVNFGVHRAFSWAVYAPLQQLIQGFPYLLELFVIVLVADIVEYWLHRAYHEVPFLWRFHAVHHSAKAMDWLAGSRQHFFELLVTRISILGVIYVLGFSKGVIDTYIIIIGFQAVLNHANVKFPWGPLKYIIVTPDFHHWHHSSDREALDRNYAANFAFLDYIFGTAVKSDRRFPEKYGVLGDYMPKGFARQQMFPFVWREKG